MTTLFVQVDHFADWRDAARRLLQADRPPEQIAWSDSHQGTSLFAPSDLDAELGAPPPHAKGPPVPSDFLKLARQVACHRAVERWQRLYRILWRLTHGEKHLLQVASDEDLHRVLQMQKAVTRDAHKMKAFVRFRRVEVEGGEQFIAWHRPDHRVLPLTAPFFARRFKGMHWAILTPDASAYWDQHNLRFGPGLPESSAPDHDELEDHWRSYYAAIFNPARIKVDMMKREMPARHWRTLPEAELIEDLLREAPGRVQAMVAQHEGFAETAAHYFENTDTIDQLRSAATKCAACNLHCHATQTVFGEGPTRADLMLVGEQPGDQDDLAGRPFVGPAGQLLDQALAEIGVPRESLYITNVVKHFKFEPRGKKRLHQKPDAREIYACRPWLEAEIAVVAPRVVVCLGATAAQAILGRDFRLQQQRGQWQSSDFCDLTLATWHPAALLRVPDPTRREQMRGQWLADLATARDA